MIVTARLKQVSEQADLTGSSFDEALVTTSATFRELYPNRKLPSFAWLKVHGVAGRADFGLAPGHRLVVSERAYDVLRPYQLEHAIVEPFGGFRFDHAVGDTDYSPLCEGPDLDLVRALTQRLTVPLLAEERIRTPQEARAALDAGAWAAIVGAAITRPQWITAHSVAAIEQRPSLSGEA